MKIKPIVMQEINTTHTSFIVDLHLDYNVTFITGDSGVGKSALYSFIEELSANDKRIKGWAASALQTGANSSGPVRASFAAHLLCQGRASGEPLSAL